MATTYLCLQLLVALAAIVIAAGDTPAADCPRSCGGMAIEYPFGIGTACARPGFAIFCDEGGSPVLNGTTQVPLNNLSISTVEALVMLPVAFQCYNATANDTKSQANYSSGSVEFNSAGVYRISNTHNEMVLVGCNSMANTQSQYGQGSVYGYAYYTGCMTYCNTSTSARNGICDSIGCCHVELPPGVTDNSMSFKTYDHWDGDMMNFSPCDYAFFVDKDNYTFRTTDLKMSTNRMMPVWLDWAIRDQPTCHAAKQARGYACVSSNSGCFDSINGPGYVCNCSTGYTGNPYIADGCHDINECDFPDQYPCKGVCHNTPGSYKCKCRSGSHSPDPFHDPCNPNFPIAAQISIGVVAGLLAIVILVFIILIRKEKRKTKQFYEKNGGPTLEKVNNIKLFKKGDLSPIFKRNNIIGQGAFGEVYKGTVGEDNQPVAVKKPKNVEAKKSMGHSKNDVATKPTDGPITEKEQFANEVIIQSRVIHKNIVKLIGCCLEVDMPILVYEFIPRGSLDDILHRGSTPLNLERRLDIAAQSADGLAYMHSKLTTSILHGDVKPANILLDDNMVPKISDFGISKLMAIDKQHTSHVIGDMTYMDPEYLQSGLLTNKSDVYSFGVALIELLTKKKASNGLIRNFLDACKQKRVIDLVDPEIAGTENKELLDDLGRLIKQCLDLDVDKRPEMTVVEENLRDLLRRSRTINQRVNASPVC